MKRIFILIFFVLSCSPKFFKPSLKNPFQADSLYFYQVYQMLEKNFYKDLPENLSPDSVKIFWQNLKKEIINRPDKKDSLIDVYLKKLFAKTGDDYTKYYPPSESYLAPISKKNKIYGTGLWPIYMFDQNKAYVFIVKKGSPAEKLGLEKGDIILEINGKKIRNYDDYKKVSQLNLIKDSVTLLIEKRKSKEIKKLVLKPKYYSPIYIWSQKIDQQILYIKITEFERGIGEKFKEIIKKNPSQKIIIDLRSNPGGWLYESIKIAEIFVGYPETLLILQRKKKKEIITTEPENPIFKHLSFLSSLFHYKEKSFKGKIVILINQWTASASESLILMLKKHVKTVIIGEKSYGKNTAQKLHKLKNGAVIKVTAFLILPPSSDLTDNSGKIKPDIEITMYFHQFLKYGDLQLKMAKQILKGE